MNRLAFNQSEIMTRVVFLHQLKRVFHSPLVKLVLVITFATAEFFLVSISSVLTNMSHTGGFTHSSLYLFRAALQTEFIVQLFLIGLIIFSFLLVRNNFHYTNFRRLFFWRPA